MSKKNNNNIKNTVKAIGIAGVVSAAIGAYMLYKDEKAAERRGDIKDWMTDLRDEIVKEVEKLNEVSHEAYTDIVARVFARFETVKGVAADELSAVRGDVLGAWKHIEGELGQSLKEVGDGMSDTDTKTTKNDKKR